MPNDVATVGVTEFKAKRLEYPSDMESRRVQKIVVTRDGKAVAPGVDLAKPVFDVEDFDAWHGKLLHGD